MKTITINGKIWSRTKIINNILRIYDISTEEDRHDWYLEANRFCYNLGIIYDLHPNTVAGITAAMSPMVTWEQNKNMVTDLITTGDAKGLSLGVNKAKTILENRIASPEKILEVLNGQKISAFFMNISGDENFITIDRHMLSICVGRWVTQDSFRTITPKQYDFLAQCVVLAGDKRSVSPILMQSATWVVWRRIKRDYK